MIRNGIDYTETWREYYELGPEVGKGGQGSVWNVWDRRFERQVLMKRLDPDADDTKKYRFLAEAQITSQLSHPGILPIFDMGFEEGSESPFYTTQHFGQSILERDWLTARLRTARLDWALNVIAQLCEILSYAHDRNVIHRDVKLENVLVDDAGNVRLIDWGAAGILPGAIHDFKQPFVQLKEEYVRSSFNKIIEDHGRPGSLLYTPPEVLLSAKEVLTPGTDVYALGIMLYSLLACRFPYTDTFGRVPESARLKERIIAGPPEPISRWIPSRFGLCEWSGSASVARDLVAIAEKAIAREPGKRYAKTSELAEDIRAAIQHRPVSARPSGFVGGRAKWVRRNPILSVASLVLGSGAMLAIGLIYQAGLREIAARQSSEFHEGEVAARRGDWPTALKHWKAAREAGFPDEVTLGLLEGEAHTVLGHPDAAAKVFQSLLKSGAPANRLSVPLLMWGEHQLFGPDSAVDGERDIRIAIESGLPEPQQHLANALIDTTATNAVALCLRSLRLDPFHYGAHRVGLSLEYLLGRHSDVQTHLTVLRGLFPNDPSALAIEATELAHHGQIREAEALVDRLGQRLSPELLAPLKASLGILAAFDSQYRFDVLLGERKSDLIAPADLSDFLASTNHVRMPRLPCLQLGTVDAMAAFRELARPGKDALPKLVARLRSSASHHLDAMLPVFAAEYIRRWQPENGEISHTLLEARMELLELAAQCPTPLVHLGQTKDYLAALSELEVSESSAPHAREARTRCLARIRAAAAGSPKTVDECRAFLGIVQRLKDYTDAYSFIWRWRNLSPEDPRIPKVSAAVFEATGDWDGVLRAAEETLTRNPSDPWARETRGHAMQKLTLLLEQKRTQKF